MMIRAASLPIDLNLLHFSQHLQKQGIRHRINEESGQQIIWVEDERQTREVEELLASWSFDEVQGENTRQVFFNPNAVLLRLLHAFFRAPISFLLIASCLLVALVSLLGAQPQRVQVLFYPLLETSGLVALLGSIGGLSDLLRTLSPMLLHFGEIHLVFNMLWLWYFGRQLEPVQPRLLYLFLIVLCSFAGNTTQYLYSGFNNFGGMSGVVYGLVGYAWFIHVFMPRSRLLINSRMFAVFVVALIAMEVFASSWIASAAHVGGLLAGLALGVAVVVLYRVVLNRESIA